MGHSAVLAADAAVDGHERLRICERATEMVIDVAYDDWCRAEAACVSAWEHWLRADPHARGHARAAYACAVEREEAAARVLARACAVAEEGFAWAA